MAPALEASWVTAAPIPTAVADSPTEPPTPLESSATPVGRFVHRVLIDTQSNLAG